MSANAPMKRRALAVVLVAFSLGITARAQAAEDPETLIRQGTELRRAGDNVRAHGYFARAYELAKTPRSAAQLGLAELALEDFAPAATHLSEALAADDAWIRQNRQTLEQSRDRARQKLVRVEVPGAPNGTTVVVAGRPASPLPADGLVWVPPGKTALAIEAPGHAPVRVDVTGSAGETQRIDLALTAVAPPPPPPSPAPGTFASPNDAEAGLQARPATSRRPLLIAGAVAAGVGAVAAVAGVLVLQRGNGKRDHIETAVAVDAPYDPADGNFRTLQKAGVGLMVGGGAALAGGVALFLLGRERPAHGLSLAWIAEGQTQWISVGGRL